MQAEYIYNALGQQVIRRLTQTGETIHSVHDMDGNRIAEYLYDEVAGTSTLLREYIWLEGTPVSVYENEVMYYIRTDHIGRPVFATDDNGTKVWEASYLPFGGVHTSSGANIDLRFPGQWFQAESGLHQNWLRVLRSDKQAIFKHAADAQRACDYLIARSEAGRAGEVDQAA